MGDRRGVIQAIKRTIFRRLSKALVLLTGHGDDRGKAINDLHHKLSYRLFKLAPSLGIDSFETIAFNSPVNYSLRYNARDGGVGHKFLMYREYEPFTTQVAAALLEGRSDVWNIGANLGYYTLLASRVAKQVRAFEPHPVNLGLLRSNVALNDAWNVSIEPVALSDTSEEISFFESESNSGDHRVTAEAGRREIRVKAMAAIRAVVEFGMPDAIVMDVQGAEGNIMRSLKESLQVYPVAILMEFWPDGLRQTGSSPEEVEGILSLLGYTVWKVSEATKRLVPVQPGTIARGMKENEEINLLCLPREQELPRSLKKLLGAP